MDLSVLESPLQEMAERCDRLAAALNAERLALQTWQIGRLSALAEEKERELLAVRAADQTVREEIDALCKHYGCTAEVLLERSDAAHLRQLRQQVTEANLRVRSEAEINRRTTEQGLRFLRRLRGEPLETLSYSSGDRSRTGTLLHHIC